MSPLDRDISETFLWTLFVFISVCLPFFGTVTVQHFGIGRGH